MQRVPGCSTSFQEGQALRRHPRSNIGLSLQHTQQTLLFGHGSRKTGKFDMKATLMWPIAGLRSRDLLTSITGSPKGLTALKWKDEAVRPRYGPVEAWNRPDRPYQISQRYIDISEYTIIVFKPCPEPSLFRTEYNCQRIHEP
jgi:hypothetical protein